MLTEELITEFLSELGCAQEQTRFFSSALKHAVEKEQHVHAALLESHEFTGKNAEQRARESVLVLAESDAARHATDMRIATEENLQFAKDRLALAETAISLWRALAYQTSREIEISIAGGEALAAALVALRELASE